MGLRDDIEDAPGKELVMVRLTDSDRWAVLDIAERASRCLDASNFCLQEMQLSATVEAALHDFALALDQAIKDHLNKVRSDD